MFKWYRKVSGAASIATRLGLSIVALLLLALIAAIGINPSVHAKNGAALGFDGRDDFITFENPGRLGLRVFTVEAWFNRQGPGRATVTGPEGVQAIPLLSRGRYSADPGRDGLNYFLGIQADEGVLAADFQERGTGRSNSIVGQTPIALDTWNHAAVSYDGTFLRLFLNGRLEAEAAVSGVPRDSGRQQVALGTTIDKRGVRAGFFEGFIDEVRIWKGARFASEIADDMGREVASAPGLLARWGMNEGAGRLVVDSTGRHPSRVLFGADWVGGSPLEPTTSSITVQACEPTPSPLAPVIGFGDPMTYLVNTAPPEDIVLVGPGSPIQFLANDSDPMIVPPLDWVEPGFIPDGSWTSGVTSVYGIGYEASPPGAENLLATTVDPGAFSIYTRAAFTVADTSAVKTLLFGADYDDAIIAWVNGTRVFTSPEMAAEDPAWNTDALAQHESSNGSSPDFTPLSDISLEGIPALVDGLNILAIGVWNKTAPTSSDLVLVPRLSIGIDWTTAEFDDSGWAPGHYGVGYDTADAADALFNTPEVEAGAFSVFTRARFEITDPLSVSQLTLAADYDDGFAAWINGQEVFRSPEMPPGDVTFDTNSGLHESSNGLEPDFGIPIDISTSGIGFLEVGTNVLAVGVWNSNAPSSSDLVLVPQLSVQSTIDLCDGIDNDCDELIDEDHQVVPTTCGVGVCAGNTGFLICDLGVVVDTCDPFEGAAFETIAVDFDSAMRYLANSTPDGAVIIAAGSPMTYLANGEDPLFDPATDWVGHDFVPDARWQSGRYGVGYEIAPPGATQLLQTTVPAGTFSVFTRAEFTIDDASIVTALRLGVDYDDGFAAWINGTKVFQSPEMPGGDPTWNTISALHESSNGATPNYSPVHDLSPGVLQTGTNVLAIGAWNRDPASESTDLVLVPQLTVVTTADPNWMAEGFDDSSWRIGVYGVGYERNLPGASNLLQTLVAPGTLSVFTRASFEITDLPSRVTLSADYDDGFIAWINGVEVFGSLEMSSGAINAASIAMLHESSNGMMPVFSPVHDITARALPVLHAGTNVLAIGVWNHAPTSSDLVLVPRLSFGQADVCDGLDNDCDGTSDEGFPDNEGDGRADCVDVDDDNDGVADIDDCHPFDGTMTGGEPPEVQRVRWERRDRTTRVLAWQDIGVGMRYDIAGNLASDMLADGGVSGAICVADDVVGTSISESAATPVPGSPVPVLDDIYYFLLRAQKSSCGTGTGSYGRNTLGNERLPIADCP